MDQQVVKRRIRIAVSVFFGVVALMLCVLWVRSYTWRDRLVIPMTAARTARVDSDHGKFEFETYGKGMGEWYFAVTAISHAEISAAWKRQFPYWSQPQEREQWRWEITRAGRFFVHIPHWAAILAVLSITAALWLPFANRFSLRTLLFATTLVAVVLGLVCYTVR